MKRVTISLDEATYRTARLRAAQKGRSISAMVQDHLRSLGAVGADFERLHAQELELREKLAANATHLRASERLSRDEVHDRTRARKEWNERRD